MPAVYHNRARRLPLLQVGDELRQVKLEDVRRRQKCRNANLDKLGKRYNREGR